jgi:hypothetical protein
MTMIIGQVVREHAAQMFLVEKDDVVRAFPAEGADQAFDHWILPRGARRNELLFQAKALDSAHEIRAIDAIPIPEQRARWGGKRGGFDHLLGGPESRGSLRDVEMKDPAPFMGQDQEDVEHPKGGRRDGEEIGRYQLFCVVVEEGLPGLN